LNLDLLCAFLFNKTKGSIATGFNPWIKSNEANHILARFFAPKITTKYTLFEIKFLNALVLESPFKLWRGEESQEDSNLLPN
jgi:hypothetical protein